MTQPDLRIVGPGEGGGPTSNIALSADQNWRVEIAPGLIAEGGGEGTPPPIGPLQTAGGGGTSGPMDAWQTTVETRLGELSSRVLWLTGGIATSFIVLLGILLARTDSIGDRLAKVETGTAVIGTKIDQSDKRLERIERILDERLPPAKKP